jgi:predicted esterase
LFSVLLLLNQEMMNGIPSERIVVCGFSQGGAIVYHLNYKLLTETLSGIVIMNSIKHPNIQRSVTCFQFNEQRLTGFSFPFSFSLSLSPLHSGLALTK